MNGHPSPPRPRRLAFAHAPRFFPALFLALFLPVLPVRGVGRPSFGADPVAPATVAVATATATTTANVNANANAAAEDYEVVVSRGRYESQGKAVTIDRYEPKAPGRYPAVLIIHGAGGMTIGGPWYRESARMLARKGYVAHVVHYFELTGTKVADLPAMRAHFPAWMRAIADGVTNASKQPNVDPGRVGLMGFSLGSYLSVSLSVFDHRVLAVVEYFGGLPDVLFGEVKTLPPTLILHGDADLVVPVSEAKALATLCKEKQALHEVFIYEGQGHGFVGNPGLDASARALAFFDTHVKKGDPTRTRETAAVADLELLARSAGKGNRAKP